MPRHLEIFWVDLNPTVGAETYKKRPCVILQADIVNRGSRTFIVAPLLPDHKDWPFAVNVMPSALNGLDKPRHINVKQIRAVDRARIGNRQGRLEKSYLPDIEEALLIVLGIIAS